MINSRRANFSLYHSFPRRLRHADPTAQVTGGLAVLGSLVRDGLLLTPEKTQWCETLADGTLGKPVELFQTRVCFTYLTPGELAEHAKSFGPFAIEYEVVALRKIGAVPVAYLPNPPTATRTGEAIGPALMTRIAEIEDLLLRLKDLGSLAAAEPNKQEILVSTVNGVRVGVMRTTIGGAEDLIRHLGFELQPFSELLNTLRAFAGVFSPLEDLAHTDPLAYYQQREWRVVSGLIAFGKPIDTVLTPEEQQQIRSLDPDFFGREITNRGVLGPLIARCRLIRSIEGHHPLELARRVIVPASAVEATRDLLRALGTPPPVESLPSLAESSLEKGS